MNPGSDAAGTFERLTGHPPTGSWAAPGRVNLIGEHTDYNEGLVLPFAIAAHAEVAASLRTDDVVRVMSLQHPGDVVQMRVEQIEPGAVVGWPAYILGVVWALRSAGHRVRGADLVLDGQVPVGAGLSSSASVGCAAALAVSDLSDTGLRREQLAELVRLSENHMARAPTGPMDQRASLLCTDGHALLLDTRDMSTEQVPLDPDGAGLSLLVIDSRVHHTHTENAYGERRRACQRACRILGVRALRDVTPDLLADALSLLPDEELRRRVRHVVTEDVRTKALVAALRASDWRSVGQLMTASHVSMRDDYEISCPELDLLVETGIAASALGARMTGGGFGGCAILLVRSDEVGTVIGAVRAAFVKTGLAEPAGFVVRPSAGARRLT